MKTTTELAEKWWPILENIDGSNQAKNTWLFEYAERHTEMEFIAPQNNSDEAEQIKASLLAVALKIGVGLKRAQECKIDFEGVTEDQSIVYDFTDEEMAFVTDPISGNEVIQNAEKKLVEMAINFVNAKINEVKLKSNPGDHVNFNVGCLAKSLSVISEPALPIRLVLKMQLRVDSESYNALLLLEKQEMGGEGRAGAFVQNFKENLQRVVLEESKEYYWLRLYLREECEIENGAIVRLRYCPDETINESIDLIFIAYEKKGQNNQFYSDIIEYVKEDDKKVLCLMLDIKELNSRKDLDMLQKLLRCSRRHEDTLVRREDLPFEQQNVEGEWIRLDYYDADF